MLHISILQVSNFIDAHRKTIHAEMEQDVCRLVKVNQQFTTPRIENEYQMVLYLDSMEPIPGDNGQSEPCFTVYAYPIEGDADVILGTIHGVPYHLIAEALGTELANCVIRFKLPLRITLTI